MNPMDFSVEESTALLHYIFPEYHSAGGLRNMRPVPNLEEFLRSIRNCPDCDEAAKLAYSDATTPGFFYPKCKRHREAANVRG